MNGFSQTNGADELIGGLTNQASESAVVIGFTGVHLGCKFVILEVGIHQMVFDDFHRLLKEVFLGVELYLFAIGRDELAQLLAFSFLAGLVDVDDLIEQGVGIKGFLDVDVGTGFVAL